MVGQLKEMDRPVCVLVAGHRSQTTEVDWRPSQCICRNTPNDARASRESLMFSIETRKATNAEERLEAHGYLSHWPLTTVACIPTSVWALTGVGRS